MFALFIMIAIGAVSVFSLAFPETDEKLCHTIYKIIMGGEDVE